MYMQQGLNKFTCTSTLGQVHLYCCEIKMKTGYTVHVQKYAYICKIPFVFFYWCGVKGIGNVTGVYRAWCRAAPVLWMRGWLFLLFVFFEHLRCWPAICSVCKQCRAGRKQIVEPTGFLIYWNAGFLLKMLQQMATMLHWCLTKNTFLLITFKILD